MRRKGKVITVDGSSATVCFESGEACAKCEAKEYCQTAGSEQSVIVDNSIGASVGDEVYVEQAPGVGLAAASMLFGLPVVLAVIGMILGSRWSEIGSVLVAVVCFGAGLIISKLLNNIIARRSAFLPRITEIAGREGS
jgi:positive regulator of sigma E activity